LNTVTVLGVAGLIVQFWKVVEPGSSASLRLLRAVGATIRAGVASRQGTEPAIQSGTSPDNGHGKCKFQRDAQFAAVGRRKYVQTRLGQRQRSREKPPFSVGVSAETPRVMR
jgi:hypothetical protein